MQVNFNPSINQQSLNFKALKPQFLRNCSGKVVSVPMELENKIASNPEVKKAIKYFETKGKDIAYRASYYKTGQMCHINFSTIDPSKSQHELESLLNEYYYPTTAILNLSTREFSLRAESFIKGYEKFVELQKQPKTPEVRQLEMMFKQKIEREQTLENVCTIFDDCCRILDLDPGSHSSILNDVLNTVRKERLALMKY